MISTHILDTSLGAPAAAVAITLEKKEANGQWIALGNGSTNSDGRLVFDCPRELGVYRLSFGIEAYYKKINTPSFFLEPNIVFKIESTDRNYHVPLLLNPYGYTTYRGS